MKFFVLGNPENRRVALFSESLIKSGYDEPTILSYSDVLKQKDLDNYDFSNSIFRIESPGENPEVRNLLIAKGSQTKLFNLEARSGEIIHTQQWYKGFKALLHEMEKALQKYSTCQLMNVTSDIVLMFDKPACQKYLKEQQIPVPDFYSSIKDYEQLLEVMKTGKLQKVFIKPAHASSASGVIAFRMFGNKQQAITTIELKRSGNTTQLFNSLKLKTYTNSQDIQTIINKILQENAIVEEWLNKASLGDYFYDLRILVIKGRARHTVVRMSKNIITNLHLGNKRGSLEELEISLGKAKVEEIKQIAERTAACFAKSLYCGVDILIGSDKKDIKVLEVNAFGDLLPNVLHQNESCYEAEIAAMLN